MAKKAAKKSRKRTAPKARKPHAKPRPEYKVTGPYSPEQGAAIVESIRARHSPVTIQGKIDRPDFHATTDLRATSDPLWRHLSAFRRRLMEGGTFTPAEWQSVLIDIRTEAHDAGLRPHLGEVEYIVATLDEARKGDPVGAWEDEPDNWSKVILTACGEAGWIQLHDLLDGFADTGIPADQHKRTSAIEWAESWMNARERQLVEPAAVSPDLLDLLQRATADAGEGDRRADWSSVQGLLLAKRERGEPCSSRRKLAAELGCSESTIRKAIERCPALQGWEARSTEPKASPKALDLTTAAKYKMRQTKEPAPDDYLPKGDVDATMAWLIDQAKPDERANLNALDDAGRRALVATYHAQNLDAEPSPLESDTPGTRPRQVRHHKRA